MIIDLAVAAIMLISAVISFLRGIIRETLTIAGIVGGLFAAYAFGDNLSPIFRSWLGVDPEAEIPQKLFDVIPMTMVADGLAYAFIFIAVVILISVISHFVGGAVRAMGLGPVDRTLGVFFGFARGLLLLGLLYLPFHLLMDTQSKTEYFSDSKTFGYVERTSEFLAGFLPESGDVNEKIDAIDEDSIKKKLFESEFLSDGDKDKQRPKDKQLDQTGYEKDERNDLENFIEEEVQPLEDELEIRPIY